jgi:hypothetical protein
MTNEEKATEISLLQYDMICGYDYPKYASAMEMAQWKDEQIKEALNNILIECDACFDEQTTNTLEAIIKHQIDIL